MTGGPPSICFEEVTKAIARMANGKTPGPDTLPGMLYRRLPCMTPFIMQLIELIY